jgi:hypothetical protein
LIARLSCNLLQTHWSYIWKERRAKLRINPDLNEADVVLSSFAYEDSRFSWRDSSWGFGKPNGKSDSGIVHISGCLQIVDKIRTSIFGKDR